MSALFAIKCISKRRFTNGIRSFDDSDFVIGSVLLQFESLDYTIRIWDDEILSNVKDLISAL